MFHSTTSSTSDLLADWRWLVGGLARLLGWSSAGDLFYLDERARVRRLDTGAGVAEPVAESEAIFDSLRADERAAEELFLLPVLRVFEAANGPLGEEHCLGFTTLPVLGGTYTAENLYAVAIAEHASYTGDVHRQIPDGAQVRFRIMP